VTESSTQHQMLQATLLPTLRSITITPAGWQLLPGLALDHTVLPFILIRQRMVCASVSLCQLYFLLVRPL